MEEFKLEKTIGYTIIADFKFFPKSFTWFTLDRSSALSLAQSLVNANYHISFIMEFLPDIDLTPRQMWHSYDSHVYPLKK